MHPYYGPSERLLGATSSWAGLVSMLAYLVFWAAAIPIAIRLLRRVLRGTGGSVGSVDGAAPDRAAPVDRAVEILRERYARGEIDTAEFAHRMETLNRHSAEDSSVMP